MRFLTRSLVGLFLVALSIAFLAAGGFAVKSALEARGRGPANSRAATERVFAANVIALEFGTQQPELTAYGSLRAVRELELRAPAAGTIAELSRNFVEGGQVAEGEVLLRLDPAEAEAARATAAASRAEAEAALAQAERGLALSRDDLLAAERQAVLRRAALDRQRSIGEKGFGKTADVETAELAASAADQAVLNRRVALSSAEAGLDQARNALRRSEIALSEAERRLADTEVRAAFAGQLSGISAVQGRLVSNNEMLGTLIDPTALEAAFRVSTAQYSRLTDAQGALVPTLAQVGLDLGAEQISVSAELVRAGAALEAGQAGRLLFARLAGARGMKVGDFVTVTLSEPPLEGVAKVPASAVGADGQVLVLGPDERLRAVPVEVLHRQGDAVLIRAAALQGGQEIVAERTPLLGAGLKLRPLRVGTDGAALAAEPPATVVLDAPRRARLIAFVEANNRMPADTKARTLAQLQKDAVPLEVVERLESRIGG